MTKKISILVICLVCCLLVFTACNANVTLSNFNKIKCATLNEYTFQYVGGMTIAEVEAIMGKPDDTSTSTVMGITSTAYMWGNDRKNICVAFNNGRAIMKTQTGL